MSSYVDSKEEPYENLVVQPQHSTSKSEIEAKTQRASTGEVFTSKYSIKNTVAYFAEFFFLS